MRKAVLLLGLPILGVLLTSASLTQDHWQRGPGDAFPLVSSQTVEVGGAAIQIDIGEGALDPSAAAITQWVRRAAEAVTTYYGRFPVARVRVLVLPAADRSGVMGGTTWGDIDGFKTFTRIRVGQHTSPSELATDWTMTHELTHSAFPDQPDDQNWIEEGLATYVEPIARAQAGQLDAARVWGEMVRGMPKGEPAPGDHGMDRTHTWGRTYWGGAMFCLVADVSIRRQTGNRKGLQEALRAIVKAGGTIDRDWPILRALAIGDGATGTTVLVDQYKQWSVNPSPVDLNALWKELGVRAGPQGAEFDSAAPAAKIREAITAVEPTGAPMATPAH